MPHDGPVSIVVGLWDGRGTVKRGQIHKLSGCYDPTWADKLYRGIRRNTTRDFRLVCLTHYQQSDFKEPVEAVPFLYDCRTWMCLLEGFRPELDLGRGFMIGLDTIICGSLDEIFAYDGNFAAINAPRRKVKGELSNGVWAWDHAGDQARHIWSLIDSEEKRRAAGRVYSLAGKLDDKGVPPNPLNKDNPSRFWPSEQIFVQENWLRQPDLLDEMYPNQILSYKWDLVRRRSLQLLRNGSGRLVYFQGITKPHLMGSKLKFYNKEADAILKKHWT